MTRLHRERRRRTWAAALLFIPLASVAAPPDEFASDSRQTCENQVEYLKQIGTQEHGNVPPVFVPSARYYEDIGRGGDPPWVDCIFACHDDATRSADRWCWTEPSVTLPDCHLRLGNWIGSQDWQFQYELNARRFRQDMRSAAGRGAQAAEEVIRRYEEQTRSDCAAELASYQAVQQMTDRSPPYPACHRRLGSWPGAADWQQAHDARERDFQNALVRAKARSQSSAAVQDEVVAQINAYYAARRVDDCRDERAEYDTWKAGGIPPPTPALSDAEQVARENRRYEREKARIARERDIEFRYHAQNLRRFAGNARLLALEDQRHREQDALLDTASQDNETRHGELLRKFGNVLNDY